MSILTKTVDTVGELEIIEQDGQITYRMVVSGDSEHPEYFNLILNHNPKSPNPEKPRGDIVFRKLAGVKVTFSYDVSNASETFRTTIQQ